jgi:hypothetical protein
MLAGHCAIGLALKARYPSVPLVPILLATEFPDLLFAALAAAGWESASGSPAHLLRPDAFVSVPFSHDVSMVAIYAGLTASMGLLFHSSRWALALGLAVFSHALLDALVLPPVVGVGGPWLPFRVGLDLWRRAPLLGWGVEMGLVLVGGWAYVKARAAGSPGRLRAWSAPVLLAAVQLATLGRG